MSKFETESKDPHSTNYILSEGDQYVSDGLLELWDDNPIGIVRERRELTEYTLSKNGPPRDYREIRILIEALRRYRGYHTHTPKK